jgi:hypothetical protein
MRTLFAVTSIAALLGVTACGGGEEETTEDTSSADQDRIEELEAQLAQQDEAEQERVNELESQIADLEEALAASETEPESEPDEDEDEDEDTSESDSPRGETAEIGEAAPIDEWLTGVHAGNLTLEEIERNYQNPECEEWGDSPVSGEFVALHLTLEAADDEVFIFEDDFYLIDDDGNMTRNEIHTSEAWGCSLYAEYLESAPAGTTSSGVVLLDTTLDSGTLVYDGGETDVRWVFE